MPFMPESPAAAPGLAETVAHLFPVSQAPDNAPPEAEATASRRRKLWEIEPEHHCIVIGTCISMPELRKLARQADIDEWNTATDYALHRIAVGAARERTRLATLLHKELERKFPLAARRFSNTKDDPEIRIRWKASLARGEVAGALWAIMTHPAASAGTLAVASEELHMLSHQIGAASRADLRRLAELEQEARTLREQLQRHAARNAAELAEKDALIVGLEARAAESGAAHRRAEHAEARVRALEDTGTVARLKTDFAAETRRAERAEARAADFAETKARCDALERALSDAVAQRDAAERMLRNLLAERDCDQDAATCPANLDGRCVLCVGGRTRLVEQYRTLVEQSRGQFIYHDGGLENNVGRLQTLLASADAVICQAGNVSHGAYYVVKRYCKQNGKPCMMLKNGALSSFQKGLRVLAGNAGGEGMVGAVAAAEPERSSKMLSS
jgi:hypothetical protein